MAGNFLDTLFAGGRGHLVRFISDGAALRPKDDSDDALHAFQGVVTQVEANEGFGYRIAQTHESSARPGNQVDRVIITFHGGEMTHNEEGRIAYQDGTDIVDCPYPHPPFRDAWKAGWQDAEEASRKF